MGSLTENFVTRVYNFYGITRKSNSNFITLPCEIVMKTYKNMHSTELKTNNRK